MKVIFCPYCAAMWRSLEPLYMEHVKAGDDVKVMPLPYWVKDSAGNLAYKKDDGLLLPAGINLVHHEDIDLKAEQPDRIYIHNPYDGDNRITSIDPVYFSDRLKACTRELVYVPYYTLADGDIESAIMAPGVFNADKIICWSESQADSFRRFMDPVRLVVKQRPPVQEKRIPDKWREKMKGRRVILFNNSLGSLMQSPDREIKKISHCLRQYDGGPVCILWRPHPLFLDTLRALYPRLAWHYINIINRFRESDGIYDDSWDLDRAIQAADEYLGDPSSVVYAFRETGKPITII